jgi:Flp pilus assembly protein TadD
MVSQQVRLSPTVWSVACLCLALSGCTALSPYEPSARAPQPNASARDGTNIPDTSAPERALPDVPVADAPPQENAASAVLLERSRDEREAGSYAAAAASLERALRIDPNNPVLWIELAEVKLAEGDADQAQMMARKALTLAGSDRSISARAERLVDR